MVGNNFDATQNMPERIYGIMAMGFSAMFTFQLETLRGKQCRHPIAVMGVVEIFRPYIILAATRKTPQKFFFVPARILFLEATGKTFL
jgi:hypothetical protein